MDQFLDPYLFSIYQLLLGCITPHHYFSFLRYVEDMEKPPALIHLRNNIMDEHQFSKI